MYQSESIPPSKLSSYQLKKRAKAFRKTGNLHALAKLLGTSLPFLKIMSTRPVYQHFQIPKANGKKRKIENPVRALKKVQQKLGFYLQAIYHERRPDCAYGFIRSTSDDPMTKDIYTNALQHVSKPYVLNIDLKDFFHTIKKERVRLFFRRQLHFTEKAASCLANLCTYRGRLPMGAPTSPVLSNLICIRLDERMEQLAKNQKWIYTRYADDMTFSGKKPFKKKHLLVLRAIIMEEGFIINEDKVQKWKKGEQPEITGLILKNKKPDIKETYIEHIKRDIETYNYLTSPEMQERHLLSKEQLKTFYKSIIGQINFVGFVKGDHHKTYHKLRKLMKLTNRW